MRLDAARYVDGFTITIREADVVRKSHFLIHATQLMQLVELSCHTNDRIARFSNKMSELKISASLGTVCLAGLYLPCGPPDRTPSHGSIFQPAGINDNVETDPTGPPDAPFERGPSAN